MSAKFFRTRFVVISLVIACLLTSVFFRSSLRSLANSAVLVGNAAADADSGDVPIIGATKSVAVVVGNADADADPGETLEYTVTINNTGPDPATGVTINDTIQSITTLVAGSTVASPVAVNDTFSSIGNVGISVPDGANDLLANDLDANNPGSGAALVITSAPTTSAQGGNVSVNTTTGAFTYNPAPGFEGADTFSYTLSNGTGLTDTATVTINVSGMIWFINNNAAACTTLAGGCGRLSNPLSSLAAFQALNNGSGNNPAANDNIFIFESATGYSGGTTLLANQKIIGQDATATLAAISGVTVPTFSDALPAMNTGGNATTLITGGVNVSGGGNTVRGMTISNTSTAKITGTNFGTLTVGNNVSPDVIVSGTGKAIDLNNGSFAATSAFTSVATTSSTSHGMQLISVGGTVSFGSTSVSGSASQGIFVNASNVNLNFGNTTVGATTAGEGVRLENNTGGTRTFGTLSITNSAVQGLTDSGGGNTSVTGLTTITNPTNVGILISSKSAGTSVTFAADVDVNDSGSTGVSLTSNAGTVTFADLDINTDANVRAFHATNNTGAITTTSGTIDDTGTATAVEIVGTSAASTTPLNMQLTSVSSNGAASGIILTNTSSSGVPGSFRILGNGATCNSTASCTGGAIQNSTSAAIVLTNVPSPSFTRIAIQNAARSGIDGQQVNNFTLDNSFIDNVGTGAAGQYEESNIAFNSPTVTGNAVSGTITVTNNILTNARRHGIQIENWGVTPNNDVSNTITNLTISNNTLTSSSNSAVSLGNAILVLLQGSATTNSHLTTGTVNQNVITNFPNGEGILFGGGSGNGGNNNSATLGANGTPINITNNTVSGQAAAGQHTGSNAIRASFNGQVGVMNFNISCNGNTVAPCTAAGMIQNVEGQTVSGFSGGSVTGTMTIDRNVSVLNHTIAAGTAGIAVQVDDGPAGGGTSAADYNFIVTNNNVSQFDGFGIRAIARASNGKMDLDIKNNKVASTIMLANRNAIRVDSGSSVGDTTLCMDMSGNTDLTNTALDGSGVNAGMGVRKQGSVATTNDFGIVGVAAPGTVVTNAQVTAFVGSPVPPGLNLTNAAGGVPGNNGNGNGVDLISGSNYTGCAHTAPIPPPADEGMAGISGERWVESLWNAEFGMRTSDLDRDETLAANDLLASAYGSTASRNEILFPWNDSGTSVNDSGTSMNDSGTSLNDSGTSLNDSGTSTNDSGTYLNDSGASLNDSETSLNDSESSQNDSGNPVNGSLTQVNDFFATLSDIANTLAEMISPTAYAQESKPTAPESGETVTKSLGTQPAGKSIVVKFRTTVDNGPYASGVNNITNTATISGSNFSNVNSTTSSIPLDAAPDLVVTKTEGGGTTQPGVTLVYTLSYSNATATNGQNAVNVVLTETVPTNTTFNATASLPSVWSCADGSAAGTNCTINIGNLNDNASGSATFAVNVLAALSAGATQVSNTSSIAENPNVNGTDRNAVNNSGPDTTNIIGNWLGGTSTDWFTAANWSNGVVPPAGNNVSIPNVANQPIVTTADITLNNMNLIGENVTINASRTVTVNGVTTLGANNINGAGTLNLGTAATITRTTGQVECTLNKNFAATGLFTFPVGTTGAFSPVDVNVTAGTGQLSVKANAGTAPLAPIPLNAARTLQRYWTLSGSGITSNITFNYLNGDVPGPPNNENIWNVIRVVGGTSAVRYPPGPNVILNAAANTFTLNGIQVYSDWTAGEPLAPTASNAAVSGQVLDNNGRGVAGSRVSITDSNGNVRHAITNPFGYYSFVEIVVGQSYVISVSDKRYQYSSRVVNVSNDVNGVDFIPLN